MAKWTQTEVDIILSCYDGTWSSVRLCTDNINKTKKDDDMKRTPGGVYRKIRLLMESGVIQIKFKRSHLTNINYQYAYQRTHTKK